MNHHPGNVFLSPSLGRFFTLLRPSPRADGAANQTAHENSHASATQEDWSPGNDHRAPSFFKKHSLLAAYIAFAAILCACLAAFAVVAINGMPAILARI